MCQAGFNNLESIGTKKRLDGSINTTFMSAFGTNEPTATLRRDIHISKSHPRLNRTAYVLPLCIHGSSNLLGLVSIIM